MEIGKPKRVYQVEPLIDPVPRREKSPAPAPALPKKAEPLPAR